MKIKGFTYTIKDDISTVDILFFGELKGLQDFQTDEFIKLEKQIKVEAESKIVFLNLNGVDFWDTEGMRRTLILASSINKDLGQARVTIIAPRDGYLYRRAVEKYENVIDSLVPWKEQAEDV